MVRRRHGAGAGRERVLLDAIGELAGAALVADRALEIVGATPAARAILGEVVGRNLVQVLCGRAPDPVLLDALRRERPIAASVRCGEGGRVVEVKATPIGEGGEPTGWLATVVPDRVAAGAGDVAEFHGMVTREPAMRRLFGIIEKVGRTESRVLVRGETGSGKELVARALHAISPRRSGPFHAINCAALPSSLLESELFGHVRGAFTGAVRDYPGHFRLASGGTLFLDEVGEMPLELQAKLLRVVETGTVIPVGGREPIPVDVRIIGATHRSLRAETAAGRFRADLMYRLRVVPIFLPPLRARRGDVALLAERFLAELSARGPRRADRFAPEALRVLEGYPWPGNVRELQNAIEYAYVTGEGPVILASDLPPELSGVEPSAWVAPGEAPAPLTPLAPSAGSEPGAANVAPLYENERRRILTVLERVGGRRERAARLLGISRATLWRRMKALGLE